MSEFADLARAIDRLAQAIEQGTLELMDRAPMETTMIRVPADEPPLPEPPIEEPAFQPAPVAKQPGGACPADHSAWRFVPAGTSKSTGKPFEAFWVCSQRGCEHRPAPHCRVADCPDGRLR